MQGNLFRETREETEEVDRWGLPLNRRGRLARWWSLAEAWHAFTRGRRIARYRLNIGWTAVKLLARYTEGAPIGEVTPATLWGFRQWARGGGRPRMSEDKFREGIEGLSSLFTYCAREGAIQSNPAGFLTLTGRSS